MANLVSFVILVLLFYGRSLAHKNLKNHIRWMAGVILADLALILYLVMARRALSKINSTMSPLLILHVCFAITTVFVYMVTAVVGWKIYRGHPRPGLMKRLGRLVIVLRVMTLVTSLLISEVPFQLDQS